MKKTLNFIGKSKIFFGISLTIIAIGLICNIIFGVVFDDNIGDELSVTLIATGIEPQEHALETEEMEAQAPRQPQSRGVIPFAQKEPQPGTPMPRRMRDSREILQRHHLKNISDSHVSTFNLLSKYLSVIVNYPRL